MRAAGMLLARALAARGGQVLTARERPWASVTFAGTQHRLRVAVTGANFLDDIEEAAFDLGEHLLADLVVVDRETAGEGLIVTIEALTIEDGDCRPAEARASKASAPARARRGQDEAFERTSCGTKRAFVPLAAA